MKRVLLIAVLTVVTLSLSFSQIAYKKDDRVASAMFGIGSFVYAANATGSVPPLTAAFDMGYNENISFGGLVSYTSAKYDFSGFGYGYTWTWSYLVIAARGAYHYDLFHKDNIDTYGGLMLGYNIASFSETRTGTGFGLGTGSAGGGVLFAGYIGARYYFTPNLAAQAEVGFGLALLNIGLAYKF